MFCIAWIPFHTYTGSHYGGGLVTITAQSMRIDGNITARGYLGSSGGGINLQIVEGGSGEVDGTGLLDVGVSWDGPNADYDGYRAGGGRISIVGYTNISEALVANAQLNGAKWGSAPGTLYHAPSGSLSGHLVVRATGYTPIAKTRVLITTSRFLSITTTAATLDLFQVTPDPQIRLVGGNGGRLEVLLDGSWGTVCGDYFSTLDSKVVCKQLAYEEPWTGTVSSLGYGTLPIIMDDVACNGKEVRLQHCPYTAVDNCGHHEDVKINCAGMTPLPTKILDVLLHG